jgi:hypothetical protein
VPSRTIDQDDILSLIATADDYGHYNRVFMETLVEWAWPITDEDIERYVNDYLIDSNGDQGGAYDIRNALVQARTEFPPSIS